MGSLSLSLATALSVITEFIHVTRAWNTILERSKGKTLLYHLVSFFPSNSFRWDRDISPLDFLKKYLFLSVGDRGKERGEYQADSLLSVEPHVGIDLRPARL